MEELNSGPLKTNPSSGRDEDLNPGPLDYKSSTLPLGPALIIESKSQPVGLANSTIELHVPSRRKKSLQSYCSVDFDFLALM